MMTASTGVSPAAGRDGARVRPYDIDASMGCDSAAPRCVVELNFLGGFRAQQRLGATLTLPSKKAQALLAVLALASPAAVTRDKLCSLLWREGGDAKQNLRQALTSIRRYLGAVVQTRGDALELNARLCATDVAQLREAVQAQDARSLEAALERYQGPLLDALIIDEPEFEQWLAAQRARLAKLAGSALAQLAAQHMGTQDYEAAERTLQRWLQFEPCEEAAHRALMRCYEARGQRSAALQQFQTCRALLKQHLGAEPSTATLALYDDMRRQARALGVSPQTGSDQQLVSVAIVPLTCRREPALATIASWISEDLAAALTRVPGVHVVGYSDASSADAVTTDLRELARELGVRYLISGGLRSQDDARVRLSLQLLGEDARYVWGTQTDFSASIGSNQLDDLIAGICAQFEQQLTLAAAKVERAGAPVCTDAWASLRRAMATLYARGWSEASVREAIELFRATTSVDATLALAWAQQALVAALGIRMGLVPASEFEQQASEAAERALALASTDSAVLGYAGCAIADLGSPLRAEPLLERAVAENPGNAQAWAALGAVQMTLGRVEAGVVALRRGLRISPADFRRAIWLTVLTWGLARLDQDLAALEAAREACRSDANCYPARLALAFALSKLDKTSEAALALREARRIRPTLQLEEAKFWIGRRGVERLAPLWHSAAELRSRQAASAVF